MFIEDAEYFTQRALSEIRFASTIGDSGSGRVHLQLSQLLLERARMVVADTMNRGTHSQPLRIIPTMAA